MPLDPQRLSRVRAHLMAAAALVTAGTGASCAHEHVNDRVHINEPPSTTPSAAPSTSSIPSVALPDPVHLNTPINRPPPSATPTAGPTADTPPDPVHINRPNPNRR